MRKCGMMSTMPSRLVMTLSAMTMAVAGVALQFAPVEVLALAKAPTDGGITAAAQVAGALFLGFATVNWMSRRARIGGIYGRPLATGNLVHFVAGALGLVKQAAVTSLPALWVAAAIYAVLAIGFALIVFTDPADLGPPPAQHVRA
jgi:hypothetical protein